MSDRERRKEKGKEKEGKDKEDGKRSRSRSRSRDNDEQRQVLSRRSGLQGSSSSSSPAEVPSQMENGLSVNQVFSISFACCSFLEVRAHR